MSNRGRHKNILGKLVKSVKYKNHVCKYVSFYRKDKLTGKDTVIYESYVDFANTSRDNIKDWFNRLKNIHNYTKIVIHGTPKFTFIL